MEKIINIICHPSHIVLYFKDQIYKIILMILCFFVLVSSLLALYEFNNKYYNYEFVDGITEIVSDNKEEMDLIFNNKKLEGSSYSIVNNDICLIFMKDAVVDSQYSVYFIFKEDKVIYYYQTFLKYELNYADINVSDFTFEDVQNNEASAKLQLSRIIDSTLALANKDVKTFVLLSDMLNLLFYFAASVLLAMVTSFFVNPSIEFKYRFRICLYDSIIFFVVMIFALLFNISWLRYVAILLPAFYSRISFKSIVRVR